MKLTTRGRYGLSAMYELATNENAPLSVSSISKIQDISETYLEQLFSALKKAQLVGSVRGAQGGYILTRHPEEITIGDILRALETTTTITECMSHERCGSSCTCISLPVFTRLQDSIDAALDSMTLQDMIEEQQGATL